MADVVVCVHVVEEPGAGCNVVTMHNNSFLHFICGFTYNVFEVVVARRAIVNASSVSSIFTRENKLFSLPHCY